MHFRIDFEKQLKTIDRCFLIYSPKTCINKILSSLFSRHKKKHSSRKKKKESNSKKKESDSKRHKKRR